MAWVGVSDLCEGEPQPGIDESPLGGPARAANLLISSRNTALLEV